MERFQGAGDCFFVPEVPPVVYPLFQWGHKTNFARVLGEKETKAQILYRPYIWLWNHLFVFNLILFLNFTIWYWFCHVSKWIRHRYTRVPHPEPSSLLPPHTVPLGHPSAPAPSIQYHASNLDWQLVSYTILYISMPVSQIIPPSPSPTESKRLFYTSVSLLLSRIQGYCYHLSKFHIYVLIYWIGVFLSGLLHSV